MNLWLRLWQDERGEAIVSGVMLVYTILALGAIVGLVMLRNQIVQELGDLAVAFRHLDQSFSFTVGSTTHSYTDTETGSLTDPLGQPPAGIQFSPMPATPNSVIGED